MAVAPRTVLEPSAQGIVDATAVPPFLYELEPAAARVRIVRPAGSSGTLPVIVYMHGGGWILGNAATHDRLVRELAVGARAALLFVEYPNSPEARYPVAIEQGYATAQWVVREGAAHGLPPTLLMADEADALRDEGEAYAAKPRTAGVPVTTVRYDGVVHDFMLLNAKATSAAIAQATDVLRGALGTR
jgi:acetyl esterase/lipase